MRAFALVAAVLALGSAGASADEIRSPFDPVCLNTYHGDSYGRGIESVVLGGERRNADPSKNWDEYCYQLGKDWAHQQMAQSDSSSFCQSEFKSGWAEGFNAGATTDGDACFDLGKRAGAADLDIGARELKDEVVGKSCVDEYVRGVNEQRAGILTSDPSDAKLQACYGLGKYDGPLWDHDPILDRSRH